MTLAVNALQLTGLPRVGEKTGIPDTRKTFRKDMRQEPADINIDCPGLQLLHIQKAEEQAEIVIIQ